MLKEKLLNKNYYYNLLSMFMKNSYGIEELLTSYVNLMNDMDIAENDIISQLDIFNISENYDYDNVIDKYEEMSINEDNITYKKMEILDNIASIFDINRNIRYKDTSDNKFKDIELSNKNLLKLIKLAIVKNNWDGSREMLYELYENIGIPIAIVNKDSLEADYCLDTLKLKRNISKSYENVKNNTLIVEKDYADICNIFKYTDIFIISMGIIYNKLLLSDIKVLFILNSESNGILDNEDIKLL